jgi:hypothetical protein
MQVNQWRRKSQENLILRQFGAEVYPILSNHFGRRQIPIRRFSQIFQHLIFKHRNFPTLKLNHLPIHPTGLKACQGGIIPAVPIDTIMMHRGHMAFAPTSGAKKSSQLEQFT